MADLPAEIITEILLLLPVKDVLSCKGVCKSWSSVIKTSDFIKLHLNQTLISTSDRYLLLCGGASLHFAEIDLNFRRSNHNLSFSELRLPFQLTEGTFVVGSCNGVICISNCSSQFEDISLYNPLTRSHFHVPKLDHGVNDFVSFGFGYDSTTDDYKVLRIVQRFVNGRFSHDEAMLFSLKNRFWKSIQSIGSSISRPSYSTYGSSVRCGCEFGCLVNEVLHYFVDKDIADNENADLDLGYCLKMCNSIACFNLQTESFSLMDFCRSFDYIHNYTDEIELRELGGCLSVIKMFCDDMWDYDEIWVMEEYGKKESSVKLMTNYRDTRLPIIYLKDERQVVCQSNNKWFDWYDFESCNSKKFTVHKLPNEPFMTGVFVGSLVSF